jgi:hypothetical protein
MRKFLDRTGQVFGRLTAVRCVGTDKHRNALWLCHCIEGNEVTVIASSLCTGNTTSCGCLTREHPPALKHGCSPRGSHLYPEYQAWARIKRLCTDPKDKRFKDYGGRGITVCERWLSNHGFENFLSDMGQKPEPKHLYSIGRFGAVGNYEPGNVGWMTPKEQAANWRPRKKERAGL